MVHALGWLGSALIVLSLVQRRPRPFRVLNLASAVVLLGFNLAIGLWSMVVLNTVILIVNAWQLLELDDDGADETGVAPRGVDRRPPASSLPQWARATSDAPVPSLPPGSYPVQMNR